MPFTPVDSERECAAYLIETVPPIGISRVIILVELHDPTMTGIVFTTIDDLLRNINCTANLAMFMVLQPNHPLSNQNPYESADLFYRSRTFNLACEHTHEELNNMLTEMGAPNIPHQSSIVYREFRNVPQQGVKFAWNTILSESQLFVKHFDRLSGQTREAWLKAIGLPKQ